MNWFLVMTAMLAALKTDENLSGIGIRAGALVPVPTEPEGRVITAINRFGAGDQRIDGKKIRVRPGRAEPDGDIFRPMVGSRTAVVISWQ